MKRKDILIDGQCDWLTFTSRDYNWYTFRAAQLEFEWDKLLSAVECTVVFLGVGIRVRYTYNTQKLEELSAAAEAMRQKIEGSE